MSIPEPAVRETRALQSSFGFFVCAAARGIVGPAVLIDTLRITPAIAESW